MSAEWCRRVGCRPATLVVLVAFVAASWFASGVANAVVVDVGGHKYGVTPVHGVNVGSSPLAARVVRRAPLGLDTIGAMTYHGGPVMHSVNNHVVFWDPNKEFTAETKEIVEKFFTDVAQDSGTPGNFLGVGGQYTDGSGRATYTATFAGAKVDSAAYPSTENCTILTEVDKGPYSTCLFDFQIQNALKAFIEAEKLTTGPTQQYFVLTPHKVVTCFDEPNSEICSNNFYCAYHSSIAPGTAGEIIYSDIPFSLLDTGFVKGCQADGHAAIQLPNGNGTGTNETTRYADVALKYTSHEYIEASTDPLGNAYFDSHGQEIGDKCNTRGEGEGADPNAFLPTLGGEASKGTLYDQEINTHHYYLQSEWDNAAKACSMRPVPLSGVGFTNEPSSPLAGTSVSFKGAATDVYGNLSVVWKWGDGTESSGLTPSHTYAAVGKYKVTMTARDEPMLLKTTVEHEIEVVKGSQAISFTTTPPSPGIPGSVYEVAAEASPSKLPVELTVDASSGGACSKSGSKIEFKAVGTCTIDANQPGNVSYNAAPQAQQVILVRQSQTINLTSTPPKSVVAGEATYEVIASATSGLPVEVKIDATSSSVCHAAGSGSGAIVSFPAGGTCRIDVIQGGNGEWAAAPERTQEVEVTRKAQTVAFTSTAPSSAIVGGAAYNTSASASSGLAAALTIDPTSASVCTISGSAVSFVGAGTCTVDANQAGSASYAPAAQVQQSFAVGTPLVSGLGNLPGGPGNLPGGPGGQLPVSSGFTSGASSVDAKTGSITVTESVTNPGTFSWLLTFQNGKFGVFAASSRKCKSGQVRLGGKCRPSKIVFAKGSQTVSAPGTVTFKIKPTASALKALKNALKQKKGLAVTATFTFQSSRGGLPASRTQTITVKLKKH